MEASRARIEAVAAEHALRSRLVEMALHGNHTWTAMVAGEHNPVEVTVSLDESERLIISFFITSPTGNSPVYDIFADGISMQTAPGQIQRGRPCRLKLRYGTPAGV